MVSIISRIICHFAGLSSLLFTCVALMSCDKEEVMHLADIPRIELVSVSHDTIRQYEDVLVLRISYQDGNGDIGFEDPQDYALFVRDIRLESFDGFYVGPITPPGVQVPIQGELTIEFPSLFLFGNGDVEQTRFQIKMYDRAGHESNVLETGTVAITRN